MNSYVALSPDMNIIENAQGYLRKKVYDMVQLKPTLWRGSVEEKMKTVQKAIDDLDQDKEYWKRLYTAPNGLVNRYKWIKKNKGAVYDA